MKISGKALQVESSLENRFHVVLNKRRFRSARDSQKQA
jgi:hypothetical protein